MKDNLCPQCKTTGKKVNYETVKNLVKGKTNGNDSYQLCFNPDCEVVYFNNSNSIVYKIPDLKVHVWFKKKSDDNCPICYCSNLTRKEIKEAVGRGYTTIAEIREFTGKNLTGQCLTKNPAGKCCHKAFAEEIVKYSD